MKNELCQLLQSKGPAQYVQYVWPPKGSNDLSSESIVGKLVAQRNNFCWLKKSSEKIEGMFSKSNKANLSFNELNKAFTQFKLKFSNDFETTW